MRLLVLSVSVLFITCLGVNCAIAQNGQWGQAQDRIAPYTTHMDRRHGHDHVYPDRGAVVRDAPKGAITVNYAGIAYRFADGVWYERQGPAYMVVAPPIGLIVPNLPDFATSFDSDGKTYLYANDVFYSPKPDLGGYEVVNDPEDTVVERSQAPTVLERSQAPAGAPSTRVASSSVPSAPKAAAPRGVRTENMMPPSEAPSVTPSEAPSAISSSDSPVPANPIAIAIHPRNGQSADQQAMDRYQCYRFAVTQTGFDPLASNSGEPIADLARRNAAYARAQAACLQGRGYSVP